MKAALLGDNIGPSLTPSQHEIEGAALGLDYRYHRIDTGGQKLSVADLQNILETAEENGLVGLNVTHPHKSVVVDLLHRLEGPAKDLQTANTVVLRDGEWIGYNTDYGGFRKAVESQIGSIKGHTVLQCGAGGAGASVALALADLGIKQLIIVDPAGKRAADLKSKLNRLRPYLAVIAATSVDGLPFKTISGAINCTPLGMAEHPGMPFDPTLLPRHTWVADIVYFPQRTAFLDQAEAHGCRVMDGTTMALWQAVEAFQLLTGYAPDADRMRYSLQALLQQDDSTQKRNDGMSADADAIRHWWRTSIIDMEPGKIEFRGTPIEDLIGNVSFPQMIWLMVRGGRPSEAEARLFEVALVAGVDHGPQAPSIAASRMAATCGLGLNNVMATGINMLGDVHGGAGEQCAELYYDIVDSVENGTSLDQAVREELDAWRAKYGKIVSGFGHRFHKPTDPRAPRIMSIVRNAASEGTVSGRFADIGEAVQAELGRQRGTPIAMNIDGATAVIFCELGFPAPLSRGLFCLSRSVGILAHAWEQMAQGGRNKGPMPPKYLPKYEPEEHAG
jgi:citrate synthase